MNTRYDYFAKAKADLDKSDSATTLDGRLTAARIADAAPDLLAALEALIRMQVKGHDLIDRMQFSDEGRTISAQVLGAIAKARGA